MKTRMPPGTVPTDDGQVGPNDSAAVRPSSPTWSSAPRAFGFALLLMMLVLVLVGVHDSRYSLAVASVAVVAAIRAVGLTMLVGWTGQFAFTSIAFFGIGAYSGALLDAKVGISLEVVLVVSAVTGLVVGCVLGMLVGRLQRYYLTIATTAFLFIMDFVWRNWSSVTGAVRGFTIDDPFLLVLGGRTVGSEAGKLYISCALLLLVLGVAAVLRRTPLVRGWLTLRESPAIASSMGIDVYRSKVACFAVSSAIFALAGAWFPYLDNRVFPATFSFELQVIDVIVIIVGGLGSVRGAVLSAVGLTVLREYVRGFAGASEVIFGVILLLVVLFLPRGIYGELAARFRSLRESVL